MPKFQYDGLDPKATYVLKFSGFGDLKPRANGQPLTEASVLAMVNKGKGAMPAFAEQLSDEEKNDLLAYLKSI